MWQIFRGQEGRQIKVKREKIWKDSKNTWIIR